MGGGGGCRICGGHRGFLQFRCPVVGGHILRLEIVILSLFTTKQTAKMLMQAAASTENINFFDLKIFFMV